MTLLIVYFAGECTGRRACVEHDMKGFLKQRCSWLLEGILPGRRCGVVKEGQIRFGVSTVDLQYEDSLAGYVL